MYWFSEILPLVEFQLEEGVTDSEAMKLLETSVDNDSDGWSQMVDSNSQTMRLDDNVANMADPFTARLVSYDVGNTLYSHFISTPNLWNSSYFCVFFSELK